MLKDLPHFYNLFDQVLNFSVLLKKCGAKTTNEACETFRKSKLMFLLLVLTYSTYMQEKSSYLSLHHPFFFYLLRSVIVLIFSGPAVTPYHNSLLIVESRCWAHNVLIPAENIGSCVRA